MVVQVLAVGDEHLVLLTRHAGARVDDGLAAHDAHDDRLDVLRRRGMAGAGGRAIEDDVGYEPEAEEPKRGLHRRPRGGPDAEADAQRRKRFLHGLDGALRDLAVRSHDLENQRAARAHAAERGIAHALGVDVAQRDEAVVE